MIAREAREAREAHDKIYASFNCFYQMCCKMINDWEQQ